MVKFFLFQTDKVEKDIKYLSNFVDRFKCIILLFSFFALLQLTIFYDGVFFIYTFILYSFLNFKFVQYRGKWNEKSSQALQTVADCTVACDNKSVNLIWKIKTDRSVEGRENCDKFCVRLLQCRIYGWREVAALLVATILLRSINSQMKNAQRASRARSSLQRKDNYYFHSYWKSINLQTNCCKQSSKRLSISGTAREISREMDSSYL